MSAPVNLTLIQQWIRDKRTPEEIRQQLSHAGHDLSSIDLHLGAYRKTKLEKRQWNAFLLLGLGALLGFISCVLSLINPVPELYGWILYGLTSIAILIIVAGLYLLFE